MPRVELNQILDEVWEMATDSGFAMLVLVLVAGLCLIMLPWRFLWALRRIFRLPRPPPGV